MNVQNATLKELIQGEKRFRVPIWQRQYTWRQPQHEQLWRDLLEQYRHAREGSPEVPSSHFLGSFVLSPVAPSATGVQTFLVIDGQQRLTTLMLVLCALRDAAADENPQAVDRFDKLYLTNEFQSGDAYFRLDPTDEDRGSFRRRVLRQDEPAASDLIGDAYRFFAERLHGAGPDGAPLDVSLLEKVVVERMGIVEITTEPGDNAHRIFQSLNGTGVDLNQADLLRNHVFMLLPQRAEDVYHQIWRPMEGMLGIDKLAGLARVDLQRRGQDVAKDAVYVAHQRRLDPISHDEAAVIEEIRDLALRARHYKRIVDPSSEPDGELRGVLGRLARWGAQTSHPVLMVAYDLHERGELAGSDLRRVAAIIESFLVRRHLARIPTNSLNRLFVQVLGRLPDGPDFADALHRELSRRRLDWFDDDRLREAVRVQPFFHFGRPHQRKMILEQLERSFGHPEIVEFDESALQIEHVMPQTLSPEWRQELEALGQDPDAVHTELVHTLGNLTLTAFNGTLSNNPFQRKQEIYGDSHLELNRALEQEDNWGRDQILARADKLAAQAATIWMGPLPDVPDDVDEGFDWTRVERAIEAIPTGRWTSYGDLAEVGGTVAQAVGNFIAALPSGTNAYRVLSSDGSVSQSFRWADEHDHRDVRDVLAAEGVEFDGDRASAAQRIHREEIASMLDDEDPSLDGPALAELGASTT